MLRFDFKRFTGEIAIKSDVSNSVKIQFTPILVAASGRAKQ